MGVAEFEAIRHLAKAPVHQTMQHAIDMKNTISTGWHTIDDWDNPPTIQSDIVLAPLTLNGVEIEAEYKLEGGFAVLGTGYNACIPQYSEGTVEIPATITIGSGAFIDLPNLTTIDMKATMPPRWQYNDVFKFHAGGIGDQATYTYEMQLLVPEGSVSAYTHHAYSDPDHLG